MTAWYSICTKADKKVLQCVVKTVQGIVCMVLPSLKHVYNTDCLMRLENIIRQKKTNMTPIVKVLPMSQSLHTCTKLLLKTCATIELNI